MKKILLLSTTFLLFFCLGFKKTVQADAYYESVELFESDLVSTPFATVLSKGYYIIATDPYPSTKDNFLGDFNFFHVEGKSEISIEDIKKTGILELSENIIQSELINNFNDYFSSYLKNGANVIKVNSSAVYYSEVEYTYSITALAIITEKINTDPTIAGNKHHFTSVEHPISLTELKSRYTAEDNVDKNISNRLEFSTNYNPNQRKLGSYYVHVKVSDLAKNETVIFDIIECKDFIPPKITFLEGQSEINVEVNTGFTLEDAKNHFIVSDNFTPELEINKYFTDVNNLKDKLNKLGRYQYRLRAKDADNSWSEETLYINIVDTTKPTISLKGGGDTIHANHALESEEILALFEVSDNYYDLSTSDLKIVSNTFDGEEGKEYLITLSLTDGSNNTREATFKYILNDTHSPIIRVEKTLFLPIGKVFSNTELLTMLKEAGIISLDAVDVSFTYDLSSLSSEGIYEIKYKETTKDGKRLEGSVLLNVFSPVKDSKTDDTMNFFYFWFLLLLIPLISTVIILIIKYKKHEKA